MNSPIRLLHIEDDAEYRQLLQIAVRVRRQPVLYTGFEDAETALRYIRELAPGQRPQLVVLDLKLPGMSGFEFIRQFRSEPWGNIPIVVFTSSSNAEDEAFCDRHAIDMLTKPDTLDELERLTDWVINTKLPFLF